LCDAQRVQLFFRQLRVLLSGLLIQGQLRLGQIGLLALGEDVQKDCKLPSPVENYGARSFRRAAGASRDPLLDEALAEVGVDEPAFSFADRLSAILVNYPLLRRFAEERPGTIHTHILPIFSVTPGKLNDGGASGSRPCPAPDYL
jgi:hypothetical protein